VEIENIVDPVKVNLWVKEPVAPALKPLIAPESYCPGSVSLVEELVQRCMLPSNKKSNSHVMVGNEPHVEDANRR
jgi:hypothetical protein